MEFFALDYAFLTLKIRKLCCEVFTFNSGVIKLHEKFGFDQSKSIVITNGFEIHDKRIQIDNRVKNLNENN